MKKGPLQTAEVLESDGDGLEAREVALHPAAEERRLWVDEDTDGPSPVLDLLVHPEQVVAPSDQAIRDLLKEPVVHVDCRCLPEYSRGLVASWIMIPWSTMCEMMGGRRLGSPTRWATQ